MAIMQLTIIPLGTNDPSVGEYVADIQQALTREGVAFQLTDMGTMVEGTPRQLLGLAADLHALPFNRGVHRVVTQIVLDERRDKVVHLHDKVLSVENRLSNKPTTTDKDLNT
ncbi:MAG: MTH1187 family thiamine-binding protein [Desulfobulbaceae bacterium]|nr:MTH1187 family thiamine-binding protein [Desulfobulbaceae bacterium]HIJ78433.1 MTH1187 family thiamine-binding protein [Deltaproteobacteria bacterium]